MKADVATAGLLARDRSALVVIDAQARLAPAISGGDAALGRIRLLLAAAGRLAVPVIVTEQHPAGLGRTVEALRPALAALPVPPALVEKVHFSAWREASFRAAVEATGRDQLVVAGFEAHVCVLQTALAVHAAGYPTFVVADAVGARDPGHRDAARERLRAAGVTSVMAEMVVFEWLERAATLEFRDLLGAIK